MIDGEDADDVLRRDILESQDDEVAWSVRVRGVARCAFINVEVDQRRRTSCSNRFSSQPSHSGRQGQGWSPGMASVVSQVGQGQHTNDGGRVLKQSAEQLSPVTQRERLAPEAAHEAQGSRSEEQHEQEDAPMEPPPQNEKPHHHVHQKRSKNELKTRSGRGNVQLPESDSCSA